MIKYEDARDHIEDGDIVFVKPNAKSGLLSFWTTFFTKTEYYHTMIAFWLYTAAGDRRLFVVEAANGGRRIVPMSAYEGHEMTVIESPTEWDKISNVVMEKVGCVPYGYLDFISIGVKEFFGIKSFAKDQNGEVCSEMVAKIEVAGGFNKIKDTAISPGLLCEVLIYAGQKVRFEIGNR